MDLKSIKLKHTESTEQLHADTAAAANRRGSESMQGEGMPHGFLKKETATALLIMMPKTVSRHSLRKNTQPGRKTRVSYPCMKPMIICISAGSGLPDSLLKF